MQYQFLQAGSEDIDSGSDSEAGFDSEADSEAEEDAEPHGKDDGAASSDEDDVGDLSWEAVMAAVQGGGSDAEEEELPAAAALQPDTTDGPEDDHQGPATAGLQKRKGSKDSSTASGRKPLPASVKSSKAGGSKKRSRT